MSEENVEIVRRMYDAWNRRDEGEMLALSSPEAEYVNSPTPDGRAEIDQIYDRGEEIIILGRLSGRTGEAGTRREDQPFLGSWRIRDGKVMRAEVLGLGRSEVDEALEAAGLSE
jgi:hypothetical protein